MSPQAQTRREAGVALRARFFAFSMQASATAHRERTYGSFLASPEIIKNARDELGRFLWLRVVMEVRTIVTGLCL